MSPSLQPKSSFPRENNAPLCAVDRRRWLVYGAQVCALLQARAENHADYKYEDYREDDGRIHIQTHTALVAADLRPWLSVKGTYVYDGISGATPTGAPPPAGSDQVPTTEIRDVRRAYTLETPLKFGSHGLKPMVAYSKESDYESLGLSATYSLELNQKNTVLSLGVSHDFDRVAGLYSPSFQDKDKTAVLVGLSQLLGPATVLSANVTLAYTDGYLSDPYKGVNFDIAYTDPVFNPPAGELVPENRPGHRFDQIVHLGLNHYVKPASGAVDASYRFYHNDYGVLAHTVSVAWLQKLGEHVVVSPFFRFHSQSAADFYAPQFVGDPFFPEGGDIGEQQAGIPGVAIAPAWPEHYSADYRLSRLDTFTYGISATVKIKDRVSLDAAYKRYVMEGRDGATSASAYPSAHVWTLGLRLWF